MKRVQGVLEPTLSGSDHSGTETEDGIAMALIASAAELVEVTQRIELLINAHAQRRGIKVAA